MTKALDTIEKRGEDSARAGLPRRPPYHDSRGGKHQNVVTYNRARINAWLRGYDRTVQSANVGGIDVEPQS